MAQNDFEDLNVMSLTETKSHRAPTSESLSQPTLEVHPTIKWAMAALFGALGGLIAVITITFRKKPRYRV
jgi:hypothetical protein